jgi:transcriptional regulator with PAS, ATPase and Fis domain
MNKLFISFIGSNDAGKLTGREDEGAILTILQERKFDSIYLLYNSGGIIKGANITYKEIADYLKSEIVVKKYCSEGAIHIEKLDFVNVADYVEIYPKILNYLKNTFKEESLNESRIYAGISSGTPAMQTAWVILAESDTFPLKLIRSSEKQHAKKGKRVFDVELLTGVKDKLEKLKSYEKILKTKNKYNPFTIYNNIFLDEKQKDLVKSGNPILIFGETGVGKEVLVETIVKECGINQAKYIAINCGGLPENLIESELFGHKKGAFTGAYADKKGIVEEYKDGVLFLDEINSLPISLQVKLLRFLDKGEYRRLGDTKIQKSHVRIISASNEPIQRLVSEGKFREDLYYRLRTIEFFIPPLRDYPERLNQLIDSMSDNQITEEAKAVLMKHEFKGNIRELKIILERCKLLSKERVSEKDIKRILSDFQQQQIKSVIEIPSELKGKAFKLVRSLLTNAVLQQTGGNTLAAGKILGVSHVSVKKWAGEE